MMKTDMHRDRPKHLNLLKIHLPVTGVVSIIHRITGVLMILCIPFCAFLLQYSLQNESAFNATLDLFDDLSVRLFFGLALWSVAHHFLAGIRYLLFDIDIGVVKTSARRAAWFVVSGDVVVLATIVWWLI